MLRFILSKLLYLIPTVFGITLVAFSFIRLLPGDPVLLSDAQSAIFKALWYFRGKPETAEVIMTKAGLDSLKPVDIFKVKTSNKGDPRYERPKLAYDTLVHTRRREGLYWMACAVPQKPIAEATPAAG